MVNVVGLGYIGLPTVLMLAAHGVEAVGSDYKQGNVFTSLYESLAADRNGHAIALYKGAAYDTYGTKDNHTANSSTGSAGNAFSLLLCQLAHGERDLGAIHAINVSKGNINTAIRWLDTALPRE